MALERWSFVVIVRVWIGIFIILFLGLLISGLLGYWIAFLSCFVLFFGFLGGSVFCIWHFSGSYLWDYLVRISLLLGEKFDKNNLLNKDLPLKCERALSRYQREKHQWNQLQEETKIVQESQGILQENFQKLQEKERSLRVLWNNVLQKLGVGVFFVDKDGKILQDYSSYLEQLLDERNIQGKKITQLFFRSPSQRTQLQAFENWLEKIFIGKSLELRRFFISNVTYNKEGNTNKIWLREYKMHMEPIVDGDSVTCGMIWLEDVSKIRDLEEEVAEKEDQKKESVAYTLEMLKLEPEVLHDFLDDLRVRLESIEERLHLLQRGTLNRMIILELVESLSELKNSAGSLQLHAIVAETEKIEKLLNILKNTPGMFRFEQILEIEKSIRKFLELLSQFQHIGQVLSDVQKEEENETSKEEEKEELPDYIQLTDIYFLRHIQNYIQRAVTSAGNFPLEVVRLFRQSEILWNSILPNTENNAYGIFEFRSLLERVLESLQSNIHNRNISICIESDTPTILIQCDSNKVCNLLAMFLTVSIWRAEKGSELKITLHISQDEDPTLDVLKVQTEATIRNTDAKTVERVKKWRAGIQRYLKECSAYLTTLTWGFMLELPEVVNKRFSSGIKMGLWGTQYSELEETLSKIKEYFPMPLKLVSDTQNEECNILFIELDILEMLQEQYEKKRKESPNTIFILILPTKQKNLEPQFFQLGFFDFIQLPWHAGDLKWTLLQSLSKIKL
ncbi:MAG TPA: Hpt domain-containing protein [Planctomycetota bacterium]|nr:Hpt domain-containing protein [Planctomycetota bacterium]HQB00491.1 Hpt domain-containing protein [Planctomycetota bacterium]